MAELKGKDGVVQTLTKIVEKLSFSPGQVPEGVSKTTLVQDNTSLREKYNNEIKAAMKSKFGYKNVSQIPKLEKVVVNCCTKDAVTNGKIVTMDHEHGFFLENRPVFQQGPPGP